MVGGPARNSNYVARHSTHVGARPIAMDAAKLRTKAMCTAPSVIIGCAHRQHDVRRIHVSQTIRPKATRSVSARQVPATRASRRSPQGMPPTCAGASSVAVS